MKNKKFDEVVTYKALGFKLSGTFTSPLMEEILSSNENIKKNFKNVCVPLPMDLNDRLEEILAILNMTKRDFFILAVESALDDADKIIEGLDIFSPHLIEKTKN